MFDLKVIHSVLDQLEEERGIPREKILEAIELALATAYKKEYGRKGQYIRAIFDINTGKVEFCQVKTAVDPEKTIFPNEDGTLPESAYDINREDEERVIFNDEQHILLDIARKIKKDVQVGEELVFPLETKEDYGRIAAQTAKQVIIQKIREAEKISVLNEFGKKEGEIVSGTVERIERGTVFINMGRAIGLLPYDEQIPGEHYNQGERIRACLMRVEETPRGIFLRLSRATPHFLAELFKIEVPEIAAGTVEVKSVAREAGARSKIAVYAADSHIDPIGSMVGQRGVRVNTVTGELNGEKIDIVDWSENPAEFIADALSPAKIINIKINEQDKTAVVEVAEDQQSLAIGKGGQNVRLAAKLTGWRIDIQSVKVEDLSGEDIGGKFGKGNNNEEAADLQDEQEMVINDSDVAKLISDGVLVEAEDGVKEAE
jgi:N utilization substance protein A